MAVDMGVQVQLQGRVWLLSDTVQVMTSPVQLSSSKLQNYELKLNPWVDKAVLLVADSEDSIDFFITSASSVADPELFWEERSAYMFVGGGPPGGLENLLRGSGF